MAAARAAEQEDAMTPPDRAHDNRRALERPDPGSFKTAAPFGYDLPTRYAAPASNVVPLRASALQQTNKTKG
jgi:hypothetical protein